MASNSLPRQPTSYLRSLPKDTLISSGGSYYHMSDGNLACHYVHNVSGPFSVAGIIDVGSWDPFSQGAVATLPTGSQYVRRGNIWVLVPIPGATTVNILRQVPGHQNYWVIEQTPYVGGAPVVIPLTISFNVPISEVKTGVFTNFTGVNEPAFPASVGKVIKGKITIVIDIVTIPGEHGTLKSSSQINMSRNITKGRLATLIVGEVEKALATANNILVFYNQVFVRNLSFEDMFLVDLVRMSRSSYQATIALRV